MGLSIHSGVALNIGEKQGIQLLLKNGKHLLIGTQRADEVRQLLAQRQL